MNCCGTVFRENDRIRWLVYSCDRLNTPVQIGKVDYCYEAHDSDWTNLYILDGIVSKIHILYQKYVPSDENPRMMYPIEGILRKTDNAAGVFLQKGSRLFERSVSFHSCIMYGAVIKSDHG